MIAHLRGKLLAKHPNQVVLETAGVVNQDEKRSAVSRIDLLGDANTILEQIARTR